MAGLSGLYSMVSGRIMPKFLAEKKETPNESDAG
jgi:hypothetical protein